MRIFCFRTCFRGFWLYFIGTFNFFSFLSFCNEKSDFMCLQMCFFLPRSRLSSFSPKKDLFIQVEWIDLNWVFGGYGLEIILILLSHHNNMDSQRAKSQGRRESRQIGMIQEKRVLIVVWLANWLNCPSNNWRLDKWVLVL